MPNMKKDRISVLIWLFFVSKVCVEHQYTTCLNLISDFFGVELFFAIGPKFRRVISKDQVVEGENVRRPLEIDIEAPVPGGWN